MKAFRSERRVRALAVGAALLLAATTACTVQTTTGSSTPSSGSSGAAKGRYTIGLANQQESVTFPAAIAKGARARAARLGVKLIDLDSQGDTAKQSSQVQDLIAQKVDAILLSPLSPGPAQALVDQADAAGVPIGTVHGYVGANRDADDPYEKVRFVLDENETAAGAIAGRMALKALPGGGEVAVITGAPGFVENTTRVTKFRAALRDAGPSGRYRIVAAQPGNWTKQDGQSACQNILVSNPGVGLFYAISDDMAVGCAAAVKSARSDAKIIGIGGSRSGIAGIRSGDLYGTVCDKPYDEGEMAVQMMHDVLTGKLTGPPKTSFYYTPGITAANVSACAPQW
ncbi:sugar ABC transporter substrate-binding protein [Streptomyces sp. TS71-3]|uniref:sugar ABC transporter substrate-binding protein n=1 Tax=Streptomyces sp. TS71-3 TaxID=2733862 RepID=UPI001AFEAE3F|nr:sugar ABC transporter substrate-binding protein [Streptomyces sp. TS71-3]GHJ40795.1 LacI family transcriptional regulator [Streptomyces sp. TS71-3]